MSNTITDNIEKELNNQRLFHLLLPKIKYQIDNPDPKYGVISPMYSLMPCFFDYFNTDILSEENQKEAERIIYIVDKAFGGGWNDLSKKITEQQDLRTNEMIRELKHTKDILQILGS